MICIISLVRLLNTNRLRLDGRDGRITIDHPRAERCLLAMTGNESIRAATVVLLREAR